jgi:hypothetical protein
MGAVDAAAVKPPNKAVAVG